MPAVRNESIVDTQQEETQVSDGQELDVPQAAPTIRWSNRAAASKAIDRVRKWMATLECDDDDCSVDQ